MDIKPIIKAAEKGGLVLKKYFGRGLAVTQKSGPEDLRTKADLESEKVVLDMLKAEFPDYNIFAEESGLLDRKSDYTFYVDPLDGTNNFVLGIPNFTVSIGLFKGDKLLAGVIHAPIIGQTYHAVAGQGAFFDGQKLQVSAEKNMQQATVSVVFNYGGDERARGGIESDLYLKKNVRRVTSNWSMAFDYCLLASGKIESVLCNGLALHDFTAGKLIAREAGAIVTDFAGVEEANDRNAMFLASNCKEIHKQVLQVLQAHLVGAVK